MPAHALTDDELDSVAGLLDGLERRLETITQALLALEADHAVVADLRATTALAGKYLLRLVHHGVVDAPESVPPWLSLSLHRFGRRPRFDGVLDHLSIGQSRTSFAPRKLAALIEWIIEDYEPFDPSRVRRPREIDPTPFRRRHVFLEASMGWLSRRLGIQSDVKTPRASVFPERKLGRPDEPLQLCIDLHRRDSCSERSFFLDIARLCTNTCAALSKETGRLATTLRQSRVAANLIKVSIPRTSNLHELAIALLAECRSVVRFLVIPHAHEDWATLSELVPPHLREPVDAHRGASQIASLARHELQEAMNGKLYGAWIEDFHRNQPVALQALRDASTQGEGRVERAALHEQETARERRKIESVLQEVWLQKHGEVLRVLHEFYADTVRRLAVHVDGAGTGFAVAKWKGTSACDVLMQMTSDLVRLLAIDPRRGDYSEINSLSRCLAGVSYEAWQGLELALRCEAADIVQRVPEARWADSAQAEPPFVRQQAQPGEVTLPSGATKPAPAADVPSPTPIAPGGPTVEPPPDAIASFVQVGDVWSVSFAGRSCAIRNSNGMEYLGQLLASPDKPIHTWTLKHKEEPPTQSSDDVIMDAESIDDVRRRVSQLQDLLNESDDALTRERAQEEIDKLQTELRSATEGTQSGRTLRHSRHPIEQTREAVGKAIQRAIEAIEEYLPELARHLRECVASPTGMSPCYRPPPEAPTWQVSLGTVSGRARDA